VLLGAALLAAAAGGWAAPAPVATTVEDVIARHAAARGGLDAWRKVQTLVWIGHTASAAPGAHEMRFVAQLQRPNRERFDIQDPAARLTRVFDGQDGWKLRPASGSATVKPFSPEEAAFAREEFVIDGPLLDHDAKGVRVRLEGVEAFDSA
jgi:hypothetical protein